MTEAVNISDAVPQPSHVPDAVVYDFDMFHDPAYLADPHERVLDLVRNAPPIFWTPRNGGQWMLLSHAANFEAARDTESFSSEVIPHAQVEAILAQLPPGTPHIPRAYPINLDPPLHALYRVPLQRVFSPTTINTLAGNIRALAGELIDAVVDQGQCEFMKAVAEPLPVQVFLKMLGLPLEKLPEYRQLVEAHLSAAGNDAGAAIQRLQQVAAAMRDTVLERREHPQDDIISMLWQVEIDGRPTTLEDLENYGVLLFIAGLDTVMQGMGHGVRHLARNPDLQDELRASPDLISDATEELLRRYTFTVPPRRVNRDMVFQGVAMKKDERAIHFLPAADLDPKEYPDPGFFDLRRQGKAHIAFNAGPHRCLGSHLARVELNILYEELLKRMPRFRLDPERPPTFKGGHVIGVQQLHLLWDK
ncbi:MAG: cytochrome P450 [Halioglobus sp.]|nr:cytochrome P450 [Halioglobus sp.]